MAKKHYRKQHGASSVFFISLLLVGLSFGALVVDMGYYYAKQNHMTTASSAASAAAVQELFRNTALSASTRMAAARTVARNFIESNSDMTVADEDISFGFIDPVTRTYDADTFSTPSTSANFTASGGYNSVRVMLSARDGATNAPLSSFFAKLLGINTLDADAVATAIYGGGITEASGLRPVYLCKGAWDRVAALGGDPANYTIRFYANSIVVNGTTYNANQTCGNLSAGNWGLADPSYECGSGVTACNGGGSPGASSVSDWFANGYSGKTKTDYTYSVQTGNSYSTYSTEFGNLVNSNTTVKVPLYSSLSGNGSNTGFYISGIGSFKFTGYRFTGSPSNRYIEGHFTNSICHSDCAITSTTTVNTGMTKLYMVH